MGVAGKMFKLHMQHLKNSLKFKERNEAEVLKDPDSSF